MTRTCSSSSVYRASWNVLRVRSRGGGSNKKSSTNVWLLLRTYSTNSTSSSSSTSRRIISGSERMRVAIIGGGVSGLSTALHLAPLAAQGLIAGPIDVYETSPKVKGRSIGVGIWSTALEAFRQSDRPSHQLVWRKMTTQGSWVGQVGYRTPKGDWLVHSRLGEPPQSTASSSIHGNPKTTATDEEHDDDDNSLPGLLFLRESDFHATLRMAVAAEENNHLIRVLCNSPVKSIHEQSPHAWSAPLVLEDGSTTERDYHLIVAADGIHSKLRKLYGGRRLKREELRLTGANVFPTSRVDQNTADLKKDWDDNKHQAITQLEDRQYTVFRGNAPISYGNNTDETCNLPLNFQTWGEGKSMRFATVHMTHPAKDNGGSQRSQRRKEQQVWFITTDEKTIIDEPDPHQRKHLLLQAFSNWHDPIGAMVASTPADQILAERALAHRHCMAPVCDMNAVLKRIRSKRPPSSGRGPAMVFIGDAFMTVDPILAQGFSVGMEAAADLPTSVANCCGKQPEDNSELLFDPHQLRQELMERHERRLDRLVCLLRATEIVQALGQPRDGTITGTLAKHVLRPLMRIAPNFVKTPFFNAMLTYSLGLGLSGNKNKKTTTQSSSLSSSSQQKEE